MTAPGRILASAYMHFAKLNVAARYNLASSGVADCALADLGATLEDLELHGSNAYGYAPLVSRIAGRFGVPELCVVTAAGTSFANHLALAALVAPGDEVLVESPTYELLLSTLGYLQARITRFARRPEDAWQADPAAVAAAITPATRLVVLTNLHNPTSAYTPPAAVAEIAAIAARNGANVLVDEVYRELMFTDGAASTDFRPDGNIVVTSSLTKAYGLSGLRCGWVLAPAAPAEKMRRLNDLYASLPPHMAERLSVLAFDRLAGIRARATALLEANRAAYQAILGGHKALEQHVFAQGTTVFARLRRGSGDALQARLLADFDTSLAPGSYFERPDFVRIGLGGDIAATRVGLERVAAALR